MLFRSLHDVKVPVVHTAKFSSACFKFPSMSSFSECLSYLLSSDPDWLNNPAEFNVCALQCLNHQILKSSASRFALSAKNKPAAVSGIVNRAISLSSKLIALNDEELFRLSPSIQCTSRLRFITSYFESCFGTDVAIAL